MTAPSLGDVVAGRFDRHRLIPGWHQERLHAATAVVAGVGALGNEVARLLAMAGIGRLILCDPDIVAPSNLSRTVLFRDQDVGRPKASTAAAALSSLAPWTEVDARDATLSAAVGLAELREATLALGCLDTRAARIQLAGRCQTAGTALIDGGTGPWGGQIGLYPAGAACYACWNSPEERAERDDPWSCAGPPDAPAAGASAPVSALVGSWQAVTAVRLCLGLAVPRGTVRVLAADGRAADTPHERIDPTCPLHVTLRPQDVEVVPLDHHGTVAQLHALLQAGEEAFTWAPFTVPDGAGAISTRLRHAPPDARLAELGVPPREILPIHRTAGAAGVRYLELADQVHSRTERRP